MTENIYFDLVKSIIGEALAKHGFAPVSAEQADGDLMAQFAKEGEKIAVQYDIAGRRFNLLRGADDGEYAKIQSYLFDEEGGDDKTQATSLANEFVETLDSAVGTSAPKVSNRQSAYTPARKAKDKESDETGSVFFVNRIPNFLPETKAPMLAHKEHYGQLLPNRFCEECVAPALCKLVSDGKSAKLEKFIEFLAGMYNSGDTDVKSIITMTILNGVAQNSSNADWLAELLPADLGKAWTAARKFIGKTVAPEKDTVTQKMFKAMDQSASNNPLR
ncbi:MAG: hypothetical protein IJL87_06490 [Clostridia bacterium]|nr:hypothetical protein [Clostridia bacterium]